MDNKDIFKLSMLKNLLQGKGLSLKIGVGSAAFVFWASFVSAIVTGDMRCYWFGLIGMILILTVSVVLGLDVGSEVEDDWHKEESRITKYDGLFFITDTGRYDITQTDDTIGSKVVFFINPENENVYTRCIDD